MTSDGSQQDHLNGQSGFLLAVFCVVSFLVICPLRIPLPVFVRNRLLDVSKSLRIIDENDRKRLFHKRLHVRLSLETAPVIGVILCLATTTIHGSTIKLGIKGDAHIKPYDVLVLFISLAYISIALDGTGALEAVAFWVSKRGGSSGRLLFTYLYAFFLLTACIVGNDPLILSGTPFLAYLTHHTGLEPTAWIFSEFMAANTASAVLVSSNPTNILITGSFGLNFLTGFTKWTVLPSIVPAALNYPVLLIMFWKRIPKTLTPLTENPWSKVRDRVGAVFYSSLMLITVIVLVGTSFVPNAAVQVWMVTMPAGILAFSFNVFSDVFRPRTEQDLVRRQTADVATETHHVPLDNLPTVGATGTGAATVVEKRDISSRRTNESNTPISPNKEVSPAASTPRTLFSCIRSLTARLPSTSQTLKRLPIPLLPFAMSFFILVRGLSQRGWIHVFAIGFARACTTPTTTVFFMGFISAAFLCPLAGTNIGATIILVEIMRDPAFANSVHVQRDNRVLSAAVYSVAMGSNIGAFSYTFAGSLAGLLWRGLLKDKGIEVGPVKFAVVNLVPLLMQITVASAIVLGEVYWFNDVLTVAN